jgi:hypothetical protein
VLHLVLREACRETIFGCRILACSGHLVVPFLDDAQNFAVDYAGATSGTGQSQASVIFFQAAIVAGFS